MNQPEQQLGETSTAVTGQGLGHVRVGSDALVSRVAEVLGEHASRGRECTCGKRFTWIGTTYAHQYRAHLATVLAELVVSERAAAAVEALESAADAVAQRGAGYRDQALREKTIGAQVNAEARNADCDHVSDWLRDRAATYRSTNTTPTKEN